MLRQPDGDEGAEVRYLASDGTVLGREVRAAGGYNWLFGFGPGIPADAVARIEVRARVRADGAGVYQIGCSGLGRFRLSLDGGGEVFDTVLALPPGADIVEG